MTPRSVPLLLAALLVLGGCRKAPADTLESRLLFTANGSFDAQAERRDRVPGGLRAVEWRAHPPLKAAHITLTYDGDSRAQAWNMQIDAPTFTAQDAAGPGARRVTTPQGEGLRPAASSGLKDVLVLARPGGLRLVTRGYAAQRDPALLPAFQ